MAQSPFWAISNLPKSEFACSGWTHQSCTPIRIYSSFLYCIMYRRVCPGPVCPVCCISLHVLLLYIFYMCPRFYCALCCSSNRLRSSIENCRFSRFCSYPRNWWNRSAIQTLGMFACWRSVNCWAYALSRSCVYSTASSLAYIFKDASVCHLQHAWISALVQPAFSIEHANAMRKECQL